MGYFASAAARAVSGAAESGAGMKNTLFYGDNLEVLRGRDADGRPLIADESVDLIYLDPPFNSAANYNVLFKAPDARTRAARWLR
jgi:16S rRNA G966 N2-methylase RsmD